MLNIVIEKWAFSGGCGLEVECGWFFLLFWEILEVVGLQGFG